MRTLSAVRNAALDVANVVVQIQIETLVAQRTSPRRGTVQAVRHVALHFAGVGRIQNVSEVADRTPVSRGTRLTICNVARREFFASV